MARTYKCHYCNKKYKRFGKRLFKHFEQKHPKQKISIHIINTNG